MMDAVVKVGAEDLESAMMRKRRTLDERLEQAREAADAKKQGVKRPGGTTNRVRPRVRAAERAVPLTRCGARCRRRSG